MLERYLAEMRRVVKPGGTLAFTLSPRTWADALRSVLRAKRWLHEQVVSGGPRGLYQREWLGIRPRRATVHGLSPIALDWAPLHGDKWLFWGRVPDGSQSAARVAASASAATSRGGRAHAPGLGAS